MSQQRIEQLLQEAGQLGATAAAVISSQEIQVKEHLAGLCNGESPCPDFGRAASCPPYVGGPDEFRKWQARSRSSITVKIELPTSVMFSSERNDIMKLLHHIVAAVEEKAIKAGFQHSRGFAGGSCKELFCQEYRECSVIAENKLCRYAESARPSMSGYGIDVAQLMKTSGWSAKLTDTSNVADHDSISWIAGLIMLA